MRPDEETSVRPDVDLPETGNGSDLLNDESDKVSETTAAAAAAADGSRPGPNVIKLFTALSYDFS
jgi:hypothetical protein